MQMQQFQEMFNGFKTVRRDVSPAEVTVLARGSCMTLGCVRCANAGGAAAPGHCRVGGVSDEDGSGNSHQPGRVAAIGACATALWAVQLQLVHSAHPVCAIASHSHTRT